MPRLLATALLNDWPYWVGRILLRGLSIRSVALESMADEPTAAFPARPRLVHRVGGVRVVPVFGQVLAGWVVVLLAGSIALAVLLMR